MTASKVRIERLKSDYKHMLELANRSDLITFEEMGNYPGQPPEKYIVTYHCRGIASIDKSRNPVYSNFHKTYVELHLRYPDNAPILNMRTPIWHPNIMHKPPYTICIDPRWWAASRKLDGLVRMIGEMIQYKLYHADNTPPYPIDTTVAEWVHWAERNGIISKTKPVDTQELLKPDYSRKKPTIIVIEETIAKPRIKVLDD